MFDLFQCLSALMQLVTSLCADVTPTSQDVFVIIDQREAKFLFICAFVPAPNTQIHNM